MCKSGIHIIEESRNGFTKLADVEYGETFKFSTYVYMKVRLRCEGLSASLKGGHTSCMNLNSGTVRLLPNDQSVVLVKLEATLTSVTEERG